MTIFYAERAWLANSWQKQTRIKVQNGSIEWINFGPKEKQDQNLEGWLIPGIANLHSHAFQRALVGRTEFTQGQKDTFWTWREAMYELARKMNPDRLYRWAKILYSEMLTTGYTTVAEFHYVHQPQPLEMVESLVQAANEVGMAITLCPVLYQHGGFGATPLAERQRRFHFETDQFLRFLSDLQPMAENSELLHLGWSAHSLRAVSCETIRLVQQNFPELPLHIHIAEQIGEVEDCLRSTGKRPVELLHHEIDVNEKLCLVHATHMTHNELEMTAKSKATVAICPTTEGNLGDGFFEFAPYLKEGGNWGIGSDSHVTINPFEELRFLEYGQRLRSQTRNVAAGESGHSGEAMLKACWHSAENVLGRKTGQIETGYKADWLVLDPSHPNLNDHPFPLDALVFGGHQSPIKATFTSGQNRLI